MHPSIPTSQKVMVMIGVMLAMFLAALDQTIIATAMPRIVGELQGLEHLSWVFTSYMLASTIIVPVYGKLSDMYGRKYFILAGVAIFLLGSILSGFAQNMFELIAFRAVQGLGAGAIFANAFAVIGDLFTPRERGRWQGLIGAVFGLSSVIGPFLGGWLTDNASWRWNFFINIPIGVVALLFITFLMPRLSPQGKKGKIDYLGAVLLAIGLTALLLGFVWGGSQYPWGSWQIISLFVGSIAFLLAFGIVEQKVADPILPLSLFKNKIFSVSMLAIFFIAIGMFGAILYVPLFAQLVLGVSATNAGTILTPLMLSFVVSSIIAGQLMSRTGKYKWLALCGISIATIALFLLSRMSASTTENELMVRMILTGIGLGSTMPIFNLAVQNAFDHSKLGVATASIQLFRSVGGTVGTAILGSVLNSALAKQLGNLSSDNFLNLMGMQSLGEHIDMNKLQGMLTGPGKDAIDQKISQLPGPAHDQAVVAFADFMTKAKNAFASSVTEVFLIVSALMFISFLVTFFLKEIPLRNTHHEEPLEEAGKELAEEEGNFPPNQPPIR